MDVRKAIEERRSVRKYESRKISDDLVKELIDAARLAPSGNNAQPSRYFVVQDDETKSKLKENGIFVQDFVYEAPTIIVCCADPNAYSKNVGGLDSANETRAIRDLSIASAFLVLRATELRLGTCYVGWIDKEKIKDVLDIPKDYLVPYVITVGYSADKARPAIRKDINNILL